MCQSAQVYWTNIDDFGDSKTNVLNPGPSRVVKEASRCNERGSTYGVVGNESGFEEVGDYTDSGSEEVGCCTDGTSEEMGDCTNREDKNVGGCNDADTDDMMG